MSNRALTEDEKQVKPVLDRADQAAVRRSFREVAADHDPVDPPQAAAAGMRWSDVSNAVYYACDETEMAVVRTTKHEWGYEFQLRTVEDYPGQLQILRTADERVYAARATVGLFDNHSERANSLLKALDRHMKAFGKKRSIAVDAEQVNR